MTPKEIYDVLEAVEQGKEIQILRNEGRWDELCVKPVQDQLLKMMAGGNKFRVKPAPRQPRERWQNVYADGMKDGRTWLTKEAADQAADLCRQRVECVHYREVIEE